MNSLSNVKSTQQLLCAISHSLGAHTAAFDVVLDHGCQWRWGRRPPAAAATTTDTTRWQYRGVDNSAQRHAVCRHLPSVPRSWTHWRRPCRLLCV